MSSPTNFHMRRPRSTAHDAAAALFEEMSHAAAAAASRNSHNNSPEVQRISPTPQPYARGHVSAPLASPPPPSASPSSSLQAHVCGGQPAGVSSPSNSTSATMSGAAPTPSLFYVRPISATRSNGRSHNALPPSPSAGVGYRGTVASNTNNSSGSGTMMESDVCAVNLGRSTPASATTALPPAGSSPAMTAVGGGSFNPLGSSNNMSNSNNNNNSGSAASAAIGSPPTFMRGSSLTQQQQQPPSPQQILSQVYTRHTPSTMSGAAPWLRLHQYGNSTATASPGGRKASAGVGVASPAGTTTPAAGSALASGFGTPKVMCTSTPAVPGTPLAPADLAHSIANANLGGTNMGGSNTTNINANLTAGHLSAGSDDEAALLCHLCSYQPCVCSRGGESGGGGGGGLLSSRGSGSTPWTAALALQRQQEQLLGTVAATSSSSPFASPAPCTTTPLNLVPPFRTSRVESGVFRGAYPVLRNFPYLRRLRLRTIVSLIPEPPTYDLKCFAEAEHIQLHHIHAERSKGEVQLLPSELSEALQLIMNADLHPLYVHCLDGRHVAGLVVMGLRKLQQWDLKAAHAEYLRFTQEEQDEVSFIADYTGPLLVPQHLPSWLWGGSLYDPATGQLKKLQPSSMRLRLSTTVTGGVASPVRGANAGGSTTSGAYPPTSTSTSVGMNSTQATTSGSAGSPVSSDGGGLTSTAGLAVRSAGTTLMGGNSAGAERRPHAAAPWMSVPHAEVIASDGQLYVDVDRVRGAAAVYSSASNTGSNYTNAPMLFSFEIAAARHHVAAPTPPANGGATSAAGRGEHTRHAGKPPSASAAPALQPPTSSSRHSSQSSSANGSMAGPPASAAAVLASAATGGTRGSGGAFGSAVRGTSSASSSSKWVMAAPLDVLQPHSLTYTMQPPSPTPSNGSNNTASTEPVSSLFDTQLSALMWTSGLTTPPTVPTVRKSGGGGGGGVATSGVGGAGGGGGGGSVAAVAAAGVGAGGGGGAAAGGGGVAALGTAGRAAGKSALGSGSSGTTPKAPKRSFSR